MATPSKHLSPEALIAQINKKFGANTLIPARRAYGLIRPRISTGSFALDMACGGGYPEGAIEILEGESASGKSDGLQRRAANFLGKYQNGIYILVNAEGTNDPAFLESRGVDLDRTFFLQPDSGEQAWDAVIEAATLAEKAYIGVDSLDALVPMNEANGDMADSLYAPAARMNNKGFRKLVSVMKTDLDSANHRITACFITQLRDAIGQMFGDTKQSVGGRGKKFAAMQIIRYNRIRYVRSDEKAATERATYALEIEFTVMKSKGAGEGDKGRYLLYKENYNGFSRGDIDNITELVPFLLRYKLVQKAGAWYDINGERFQGEVALADYLRSNHDLQATLIEEVKRLHSMKHEISEEAEQMADEAEARAKPKSMPRKLLKGKSK